MAVISIKQFLEASVRFGHQIRRWGPEMVEHTFTERNDIYVIGLQKTIKKFEEAYSLIHTLSEEGRPVLFVGIRKQAQDSIHEETGCIGAYHMNTRWLGGMLTNFRTICHRIDRLNQLKTTEEDGIFELLPKKEAIKLRLEIEKPEKFLGGIRGMRQIPSVLFIADPRKERIAVTEAKKLGIPIVAIVDTNCDPGETDYVIPDNGGTTRTVKLISVTVASATAEGEESRMGATAAEEREEAQAK